MNLKDVIIAPVMTEKGLRDQENGLYTFWVRREASKAQIKSAIESLFKVKVEEVWPAVKGGEKRRDWRRGKTYSRPRRKKAYVKIASGQKIELLKGK